MVRSIVFFAAAWGYQVLVLPVLPVLGLMLRAGRVRRVRRVAGGITAGWARMLLWIAGARLTVRGRVEVPADQPVLFVSNHQGAFDIGIIAAYAGRPVGFISKAEIGRIPSVGRWMKLLGCIVLDRGDTRQGVLAVERAVAALRAGDSLVIFPEGTRSNGPRMRRFKTGAARMAMQAGVPIIPLTMRGAYRLRKGDAWRITPAEVEMVVGAPIAIDGLGESDAQRLTDQVRKVIERQLEDPAGEAIEVREESAQAG
jgi:1-acyl-sn-glycerol-3-phosphate acyltransferase